MCVCVYLGEDGPSQMGLEDLAMFRAIPTATIFYPSDGVSTEKAVELSANTKVMMNTEGGTKLLCCLPLHSLPKVQTNVALFRFMQGLCFIRTSRPENSIIYNCNEDFHVGQAKVCFSSINQYNVLTKSVFTSMIFLLSFYPSWSQL